MHTVLPSVSSFSEEAGRPMRYPGIKKGGREAGSGGKGWDVLFIFSTCRLTPFYSSSRSTFHFVSHEIPFS